MRYVSTFSGIEAASCAWEPLGWEPLAFSEIEPFPCQVLEKRYPNVPNLGDVRDVDWGPYHGRADVVVGGSPCQSFSTQGLRTGLDDPRGRLMHEYVRAVADIGPRWLVWENVPGVLSQDGGRAFGTLLSLLGELGYRLCWRVLDAQFWGVAQRRRRVYLVGSLGGFGSAAVLLEPGCVPGGPGQSDAKRAEVAGGAGGDTHEAGGPEGGGRIAYAVRTANTKSNGWGIQREVTHTLDTTGPEAVAFKWFVGAKSHGIGYSEGCSPTLTDSSSHVPAVTFESETGDGTYETCVRRLTPTECERLMGFPDGWTDVDGASDSKRYKALGNSMAVPVMRWIGERIDLVDGMVLD